MFTQTENDAGTLSPCTCVCADVLDVVALAVRKVGTLAAGVQFAGEVIPQVFPPVVLTDGGVRTQSALKDPAETQQQQVNTLSNSESKTRVTLVISCYLWSSPSLLWCFRWAM